LSQRWLLTAAATNELATALVDVIASGALDSLATKDTAFRELSMSRLGYDGDSGLAQMIFEELRDRGLARETNDGVSIPMHPMVRSLVLTLLSQILRPYGKELGLTLNPVTDRPHLVEALSDLLSTPVLPSTGSVFSFDLLTVGVDLGPIPIDEVLDFRRENYNTYREYSRDIRRFVWELSDMPPEQRQDAFEERQSRLEEIASEFETPISTCVEATYLLRIELGRRCMDIENGGPFGCSTCWRRINSRL
jgi:hypothetical protein